MKPVIPLTHCPDNRDEYQYRPDSDVWGLMRRVFRGAAAHRGLLLRLAVQVALRGALLPLGAWVMGAVINGPIERREVDGILVGAAGYGLLAVLTNWLFHYRYLYALAFGEEVVHDLRARLFRHVMSMPMAYFDTVKVGRLIGRLTSDVDGIRGGVQDVVFISAVQVGQMVVAGVMMAVCSPWMFLSVLMMAPVVWWADCGCAVEGFGAIQSDYGDVGRDGGGVAGDAGVCSGGGERAFFRAVGAGSGGIQRGGCAHFGKVFTIFRLYYAGVYRGFTICWGVGGRGVRGCDSGWGCDSVFVADGDVF